MSIFGSIMGKIFGRRDAAAATPTGTEPPAVMPTTAQPMPTPGALAPGAQAAPPMPPVDVGAVLTDMASKSGQTLNYKTSIVDLMKLLGLDSSLENRKELARELHFSGDMNDSASMNIWLHKQVMKKLAENGGMVPADLKD